ncbi:MAG: AMP-binding protein, partial [Planctomycetota bacterium]
MDATQTVLPTEIAKSPHPSGVTPNLDEYDAFRARFSWNDALGALSGLPSGRGVNIAHEAVDRHAEGALADKIAVRWLGKTGETREFSYKDLRAASNRFANVLAGLGVVAGDRVFALSGRIPELYFAALGTLKHRAIFCPLFSAFGPEPIRSRMEIGQANAIVTTPRLYRRKVAGLRDGLPSLEHVLIAG